MIRRRVLFAVIVLALATAAVYRPVTGHDFLDFDDDVYVTENDLVKEGLTIDGLRWAFAPHAGNWHPLTWLSHMLDVELFGMNAGPHHGVNLAIHVGNAVLLLAVLLKMTGRLWASALTAGLFAVHPLHVESVAWVAERKDLLAAFFSFLAMAAYVRYVRRPDGGGYLLVVLAFALGLMTKPMVVTLPFVLLLLDYWPLGRAGAAAVAAGGAGGWRRWRSTLLPYLEKLPLFLLAAAVAAITLLAQHEAGAVAEAAHAPPGLRAANAAVSYCRYVLKTIWPAGLSVFYPYPVRDLPLWQVAGAVLTLVLVTAACLRARKTSPGLAVGWLWFAGTLVPVIGVVQVGAQAMADRYTYLPLVGLFVAAVWGAARLLPRHRQARAGALVAACALLATLMASARLQVGHWKDDVSLYSHAIEVTSGNDLAHLNLGAALFARGRTEEAAFHFQEVLRIDPRAEDAHNNLGAALFKQGLAQEALKHFQEAIRLCPDFADPYNRIGILLLTQGRSTEAAPYFAAARRLADAGVKTCGKTPVGK